MSRILIVSFLLCLVTSRVWGDVTLITYGSTWKYRDLGTDPGNAWKGAAYNDASWSSGAGQLGYGDGDETTVVAAGCTPVATCSPKYITTYFRKSFTVGSTATYSGYTLNLRRDDGVIVYLDSTEIFRNNMPVGAVTFTTLASAACADDGTAILTTAIALGNLPSGNHVLAVEIHQNAGTSSDISFDLELIAVEPGSLTIPRGPYLNLATQNSVHIRWRSSAASDAVVRYGTDPANLVNTVTDATLTTEHDITLTGLTPDTRYYYSVGHTNPVVQTLRSGTDYFVQTLPVKGTNRKTRIWAIGDCGNNSVNQQNVLRRYMQYMDTAHTDAMLLLGDNAYNSGLDNEYQSSFFPIYQDSLLRNVVLWPAPGNHDYANNATRQNDHAIPYYGMFSLPMSGEAGGVASGTEAFYSFDHGNVHFIALDSYGKESNTYRIWDTLGPQINWLKNDLAANTQTWTIAYWHHPPYTLGSHTSETETDLIAIRTNVIRILERNGVDLILCGHSHVYERSYFMNGHYGNEASFNLATHGRSSSRGWYNDSTNACPYIKNAPQVTGTVYAVVGSSGQLGGSSTGWPHAAMVYSNNTLGGGLAITVEGNRLDAEWVSSNGTIGDRFTMMKQVQKKELYAIYEGDSLQLVSSWQGSHTWPDGTVQDNIRISPPGLDTDTVIVVDGHSCLSDTFILTKVLRLPVELVSFSAEATDVYGTWLSWVTASETGSAYFEVEWSVNMVSFFPVGWLTANGHSSETRTYSLIHPDPAPGLNYYRLKQVDMNGQVYYSRVAVVRIDRETDPVLPKPDILYVHPRTNLAGQYDIDLYTQKNKTARLQVFNALGILVRDDQFSAYSGVNQYALDLSGQAPGLYLIAVDDQVKKILR